MPVPPSFRGLKMPDSPNKVYQQLENYVNGLTRDLVVKFNTDIAEVTPIDTGWAQTNWVASVGNSIDTTQGTRLEAEEGILYPQAQMDGINQIRTSYNINQGNVFISNNVPYITDLNEGTSAQAPEGFVQIYRDLAITFVQTQARNLS